MEVDGSRRIKAREFGCFSHISNNTSFSSFSNDGHVHYSCKWHHHSNTSLRTRWTTSLYILQQVLLLRSSFHINTWPWNDFQNVVPGDPKLFQTLYTQIRVVISYWDNFTHNTVPLFIRIYVLPGIYDFVTENKFFKV